MNETILKAVIAIAIVILFILWRSAHIFSHYLLRFLQSFQHSQLFLYWFFLNNKNEYIFGRTAKLFFEVFVQRAIRSPLHHRIYHAWRTRLEYLALAVIFLNEAAILERMPDTFVVVIKLIDVFLDNFVNSRWQTVGWYGFLIIFLNI